MIERAASTAPLRISLVALLLAAVLLAGCRSSADSAEAVTRTGDSPLTRQQLSLIERRQRAMITIRFHAYRARKLVPAEVTPEELGLMSLREATDFLLRDSVENVVGRSRRRRAIALLAGYSEPTDAETTMEWQRLVANDATVEEIARRLAPEAALAPEERESLVYDMLNTLSVGAGTDTGAERITLVIPGCGPKDMKADGPDVDLQAGTATAGLRVTVTRSAKDVRKRLDPQNWDRYSIFFAPPERTFLVAKPQPTSIVPCADFDSVPRPSPDPPIGDGDFFEDRFLYEHATCSACKGSKFKNILRVDANPGAKACEKLPNAECTCPGCSFVYQACYSLEAALSACVGGETAVLKIDEGHLSACELATGETQVRTKKKIHFKDAGSSVGSFFAFFFGQQEMQDSLAEQLCCPEEDCPGH